MHSPWSSRKLTPSGVAQRNLGFGRLPQALHPPQGTLGFCMNKCTYVDRDEFCGPWIQQKVMDKAVPTEVLKEIR